MIRTTHLTWIALCGVLAVGCGSDPKPEPDTAADQGAGTGATDPSKSDGDDAANRKAVPVGIDPRIAEMCDLPEARFDFDSSAVSSAARTVLDALAECFVNGKGKGHKLNLVGHADERGETEYNLALGHRRAGGVAAYLAKKGLGDDRVDTSSEGDREATIGADEAGWAKDRKVEILLRDSEE